MAYRPRTVVARRVQWFCVCAWVMLVLTLPLYWLSTLGPDLRGGARASEGGFSRDDAGGVVFVMVEMELTGSWWLRDWVGRVATVTISDTPVDDPVSESKLRSRAEVEDVARQRFSLLCTEQGCAELAPLFDQAIAGGRAEVTYPWLYIVAAAQFALPWWLVASTLLVIIATTWVYQLEPDSWENQQRCSACGYSRAGLGPSSKCPECGCRTHG